ncbi:hypothetical protein LPTSP3_g24480 [Leptospira kobayashii]|uniref:Lipoprotein n=1 Tax=Leptospira kobayashii TaxID=1917830 RepID=A0ABM7US35_9LEPT|nr:hypothetical protein [Leptospira kobayashii]BDA79518.1 hypothetical protein LPTSP3_g24480 [Leptospira kobayashii]
MKYLFSFSVLLNVFLFVFIFKTHLFPRDSHESNIMENRGSGDCSETGTTSEKNIIKYSKPVKQEVAKLSRVYLLPHPPDFLEGKYINIQKFEKINIEGKIFWRLEEVTDNGKVKSWEVEESSVRWK